MKKFTNYEFKNMLNEMVDFYESEDKETLTFTEHFIEFFKSEISAISKDEEEVLKKILDR